MGIIKTTYHLRNATNSSDGSDGNNGDDMRLVLLIEDVFSGLTIENVYFLITILKSWLESNGATQFK